MVVKTRNACAGEQARAILRSSTSSANGVLGRVFGNETQSRFSLVPEAIEPADSRIESGAVEGIEVARTDRRVLHETRGFEQLQVPRYCRATDGEGRREVGDALRSVGQQHQQPTSLGIAERIEDVVGEQLAT